MQRARWTHIVVLAFLLASPVALAIGGVGGALPAGDTLDTAGALLPLVPTSPLATTTPSVPVAPSAPVPSTSEPLAPLAPLVPSPTLPLLPSPSLPSSPDPEGAELVPTPAAPLPAASSGDVPPFATAPGSEPGPGMPQKDPFGAPLELGEALHAARVAAQRAMEETRATLREELRGMRASHDAQISLMEAEYRAEREALRVAYDSCRRDARDDAARAVCRNDAVKGSRELRTNALAGLAALDAQSRAEATAAVGTACAQLDAKLAEAQGTIPLVLLGGAHDLRPCGHLLTA